MLDDALAQIPDAHRYGTDLLIRTDSAGSAKAFLTHIRSLRERGIRTSFSVGCPVTEPIRRAIRTVPDRLWHPALDQAGSLRDGAQVAELTGMTDLAGRGGARLALGGSRRYPPSPSPPEGRPSNVAKATVLLRPRGEAAVVALPEGAPLPFVDGAPSTSSRATPDRGHEPATHL